MKNIIMLGVFPYDAASPVGEHEYGRRLYQDGHRILWFTTFLNPNRFLRRRADDRELVSLWRRGVVQVNERVWQVAPLAWLPYVDAPVLRSRLVAENYWRFLSPSPRLLARKLGFENPDLVWAANPRYAGLARRLNAQKMLLRVSDDFSQFRGEPPTTAGLLKQLCSEATVVATAHNTFQTYSQWAPDIHYVSNGFDPQDILAGAFLSEPARLAEIPGPRAVYVGAISHWFDLVALAETARRCPNWSFVIIGPVLENHLAADELAVAKGLPNVHFVGPIPHDKVGAWLVHSDVGMIPFVKDRLSDSINPIKLYEYAACGLHTISRDLDEVRHIGGPVSLYHTPEEFSALLHEGRWQSPEECRAWAQQNTWDIRYQQIKEVLGW